MIDITYSVSTKESAQAAMDFFLNRPMLAFLYKAMQGLCVLLCCGFLISITYNSIRVQDTVAAFTALMWLVNYKRFNRWLIQYSLNIRNLANTNCRCKIDKQSIFFQSENKTPVNIEWKKLRFILRTKTGYIIPVTGISNGGKFLWLPLRSLQNTEDEFLKIINNLKMKIKKIK